MLKWIKNSKSTYPTKTGYKGIEITKEGKYVAKLMIRIADGHNKPKKVKGITIGTYGTIKEAKIERVKYILRFL